MNDTALVEGCALCGSLRELLRVPNVGAELCVPCARLLAETLLENRTLFAAWRPNPKESPANHDRFRDAVTASELDVQTFRDLAVAYTEMGLPRDVALLAAANLFHATTSETQQLALDWLFDERVAHHDTFVNVLRALR